MRQSDESTTTRLLHLRGQTDFYPMNTLGTGGEPAYGVHVIPNPKCRQQVVTWNMPQTSSRPVSEAGYRTTMTTPLPLVPEENLSQTAEHQAIWPTTSVLPAAVVLAHSQPPV